MYNIIYPPVPTYYIAWQDTNISYGITDTDQQTTTGLANCETFTDEDLYQKRLLDFGVDLNVIIDGGQS